MTIPAIRRASRSSQNYGNSLGLDFEVLAPIDVLALGMFDGNNNVDQSMFYGVDLSSGVTVLIYNIPTDGPPTIVASVYFNPANFQSQPAELWRRPADQRRELSVPVERRGIAAGQLQRGGVERLELERQLDWSSWWDEPLHHAE